MKCYGAYTADQYTSYPPYISINEGYGDVVHIDVRSVDATVHSRMTMPRDKAIAFLRETLERLER